MRNLLFLTIFLLIQSCSPTKRLENLLAKHPELGKTTTLVKEVTIYETDTILVPGFTLDTTINYSDSIFIEDSLMALTIIKLDTFYKIRTRIKDRTIIQHDTIKYTYTDTINVFKYQGLTFKEKSKYRGQGMLILFILILLLIIGWFILKKYINIQFPFLKLFNLLK